MTTIDFSARADDADNYTVEADCVGRHISVHAIGPDGGVWRERFTTDESRIYSADVLQSYCRTILAQWSYNRRHKRHGGAPWGDA